MKEFILNQREAREIYPKVSQDFKIRLEEHFGTTCFSQNIMDRVMGVESACAELGIDFNTCHDSCEDSYDEAEQDIKIVAEALREGKPARECFYYPYLYNNGSGFRLRVAFCGYAFSVVGARLRVDTYEKAMHLGRILEKQLIIYLTDPK